MRGVTLLNACFTSSEAARKAKSCPRSCLAAASLLMSKGMSFLNLFVQLLHAFSDLFPPILSDPQNTTLRARSECMYLQSAPRSLLEASFFGVDTMTFRMRPVTPNFFCPPAIGAKTFGNLTGPKTVSTQRNYRHQFIASSFLQKKKEHDNYRFGIFLLILPLLLFLFP